MSVWSPGITYASFNKYLESIKEARGQYRAGKVKTHEEVFGG